MSTPQRSAALSDIVADWVSGRSGPLYERLADALRGAIDRGELKQGTVLPPERKLAAQLLVSRKTVLSAFDALKSDGYLESRQGSGTWVSRTSPKLEIGSVDSLASLGGILLEGRDSIIDMTSGNLEASPFVAKVLSELGSSGLQSLLDEQRPAPLGLPALVSSIVRTTGKEGLNTDDRNVIVTSGAQQAVSLLAAHYLRPGDVVLTENLTSLGALDAFRAVGARIEPIGAPGGDGSRSVDALLRRASEQRPTAIYLIPTYHNVTGSVLSEYDRRRVARYLDETGVPLIEDRSHSSIGFVSPPPPVASYVSRADVAIVDSMSKRAWSGLRVGWILAPDAATSALRRAKTVADLGTSELPQLISATLLDLGPEVTQQRVAIARERRRLLEHRLGELCPSWRWDQPSGGLSLWVALPDGTDARQFAQAALRAGVAVLPGPLLSAAGDHVNWIRVSYHLPAAQLEEGARRLAAAWFHLQARRSS